jgi:hypothetical protein
MLMAVDGVAARVALLCCIVYCTSVRAELPQLPQISAAIPGIPFNGNALARHPLDLRALAYDEHEYFLSGRANVYDAVPGEDFATTILREGAYTTRILLRKPSDPRRWNGTVVVEVVNMTGFSARAGFDYPGVWANNWREITHRGMAYVGITSKPNVFDSLRRFDARRYAGLKMDNPLPAAQQVCGTSPDDANYDPNLSRRNENGLVFDAFTQLAMLLRSRSPANPLAGAAQHVYLTGLSQSAGYVKTYLRFIVPRTEATGSRAYDGYRIEGASGSAPINQCAAGPVPGDPQPAIPDRGVPLIELHSAADYMRDLPRRPDSPWYRRWEVAATFHDDEWSFEYGLPNLQTLRKSLPDDVPLGPAPRCPAGYPPDPPYQDVYDSSLRALDQWVRHGTPAPMVPYLQLSGGKTVADAFGNSKGGLQLPATSVPVASYRTEYFEPQADCSHKIPLTHAQLQRLYANHEDYVKKLDDALQALVRERLLTPEDAADELAAASKSRTP